MCDPRVVLHRCVVREWYSSYPKISTFQLDSDKARSGQARFLIAPVENRTCPFEGIRLNTFD